MISNVMMWELGATTMLEKKHFFKFWLPYDTATVDLSAGSEDDSLYTFKRSCHKKKSSEDVKKIISILEGKWILI